MFIYCKYDTPITEMFLLLICRYQKYLTCVLALSVPLAECQLETHYHLLKEDMEKIDIKTLNTIYKTLAVSLSPNSRLYLIAYSISNLDGSELFKMTPMIFTGSSYPITNAIPVIMFLHRKKEDYPSETNLITIDL